MNDRYHAYLASNGLPKNRLVTQKLLNSTHLQLEEILRILKKNEGKNIHWNLNAISNLTFILKNLPPSPLVDQFLKDFEEIIRLLKAFLKFYERDLSTLAECEKGEKNRNRWARLIFYNFALNFSSYDSKSNIKILSSFFPKKEILLPESSLEFLEIHMRGVAIQSVLSLARSKNIIEIECAEIQARESQARSRGKKSSRLESKGLDERFSAGDSVAFAHSVPSSSSSFSHSDPQCKVASSFDLVQRDLKSLSIDSSSSGSGSSSVFTDASVCEKEESKRSLFCKPLRGDLVASFRMGGGTYHSVGDQYLGASKTEDVLGRSSSAAAAGIEFDERVTEVCDEMDPYVAEILAEHRAHQIRKKIAAERIDTAESSGRVDAVSTADLIEATRIILASDLADSYRAVRGLKVPAQSVRNLTNKDVLDLIHALVGGIHPGQFADVRYILPQLNTAGAWRDQDIVFKMHLRHAGKEYYPQGTLSLFRSAIRRANLEQAIVLADQFHP